MAFLDIQHLEKSYGANHVVKDFSLSVEKGEFISLLGPSGCGKTTVLRMVAGFETQDMGSIEIDGVDVGGLKANQRNIGMMFQAYALFPNLTVAQNVGFGLRVAGVGKAETKARIAEMLSLIGLESLGDRYPFQLSGGQQQRVALARALAVQPRVLLLDEPLSALDAKIRVSLREEMRAIQQRLGITTIFVTHDQEEALSMSDRVVVMHKGVADQIGTPFEIYNRPTTRFVANFVGTLNVLEAEVLDPEIGRVRIGAKEVILGRTLPAGKISLAARPEMISLGPYAGRETGLDGTIIDVQFLGSVIRLRAQVGESVVALDTFNSSDRPPPRAGENVQLSLAASDLLLIGE